MTESDFNRLGFCGGLAGAFGYDTVRYIEHKLASDNARPLGVPDILLLLSEEIAIVDNLSGKLTWWSMPNPASPAPGSRPRRGSRNCWPLRAPVSDSGRVTCACLRTGRLGIRRGGLQGRRAARQAVHRRWRHHAGGALAAHEASPSPRARWRFTARCAR
jgi:hypothetical protein